MIRLCPTRLAGADEGCHLSLDNTMFFFRGGGGGVQYAGVCVSTVSS